MPPRWEVLRPQGAEPESSLTVWEINHSRTDGGSPSTYCSHKHTRWHGVITLTDRCKHRHTRTHREPSRKSLPARHAYTHPRTHAHTHTLSVCQHHLNTIPSERTTRHCRSKRVFIYPQIHRVKTRRRDRGGCFVADVLRRS